jgi:hypothetical protein
MIAEHSTSCRTSNHHLTGSYRTAAATALICVVTVAPPTAQSGSVGVTQQSSDVVAEAKAHLKRGEELAGADKYETQLPNGVQQPGRFLHGGW